MDTTTQFLLAALLIESIVIYLLMTGKKNHWRMSDIEKKIFTLGNGTKVFVHYYAAYEKMVSETHPNEGIEAVPFIALGAVLGKKKKFKGLKKEDIEKEASRMAKEIKKRMDPNKDKAGKVEIVIIENLRRPTPEDIEEVEKLKKVNKNKQP